MLNIIANYIGAMLISKIEGGVWRKICLVITICVNLGVLFYFKYFNFVVDSFNRIFDSSINIVEVVLPIGISFFTFQGLSYVIDVYRKKVPVQKNPLKVALYIVLFPQLIAGPIVRYIDIEREIDSRKVSLDDFTCGIKRFIIGLAKKAILANTLAVTADSIWAAGVDQNTVAIAWVGSIAYTLQIFFDFSGYSDMAIGLGRMFGFHFLENFNLPYISKSITEFWRRWHISLSSWFRDYVYIPLGGNRKRVYLNLAIVFLLTGIWHGAAWQFILWGMVHGVFILIERIFKKNEITLKWLPKPVAGILGHIYTLFVVNSAWILFRAPGTHAAIDYFGTMFGVGLGSTPGVNVWWYLDYWTIFIMVVAIFFSTSIPTKIGACLTAKVNENVLQTVKYICLFGLLIFSMLRIVSGTYNPFIYFQF
ncbi:MAG: MBOAT family O-acyltransferase [Agathobacter sp.]